MRPWSILLVAALGMACTARHRSPPPATAAASVAAASPADTADPWPKTVAEAAAITVKRMSAAEREDLRRLSREQLEGRLHGYQMTARNQFGLLKGNTALLRSCGSETIVLEDCLLIILEATWASLQRRWD
jgi:hypothetical protein